MNDINIPIKSNFTSIITQKYHTHGNSFDAMDCPHETYGMKKMGDFLKNLRQAKGLTRDDAAEPLDLNKETIRRLETLSEPPNRGNTVRRLLESYGSSMEQLAAWMKEGPDNVPPATDSNKEKPMTDISVLARLDEIELRMLKAAIDTRLEHLAEKPNAAGSHPARTSRKTA